MKYIKKFNEGEKVIEHHCLDLHLDSYVINDDDTVDVNENVRLSYLDLLSIPIQFGKVNGHFDCSDNLLSSLIGCPKEVNGFFDCDNNSIITLEGGPKKIEGSFFCNHNRLKSLIGNELKIIKDGLHLYNNSLITLEGCPEIIENQIDCSYNRLTSLEYLPKNFDGSCICLGNLINNVYGLFGDYKEYKDSLDYGYWSGSDIIKLRFREACEEAGIKMPESIEGYKYI